MRKTLKTLIAMTIVMMVFGFEAVASASTDPIVLFDEVGPTVEAKIDAVLAEQMVRVYEAMYRIYCNCGYAEEEDINVIHEFMENKDDFLLRGNSWALHKREDSVVYFYGVSEGCTDNGYLYTFLYKL